MPEVIYYYLFEDGDLLKSKYPPTDMDIQMSNEGILFVIDTKNHTCLEGIEWVPIEDTMLLSDPFSRKTFHTQETYE